MRDLTPNDPHDVPAVFARRRRRLCHFARLEGTGVYRESRPRTGHQRECEDIHARPDQPRCKAGKMINSLGGNFNPAYSPDGKYLAWRSEARAGYEGDKFRLFLYDRAAKTIRICCRNLITGWMSLRGLDSKSIYLRVRNHRGVLRFSTSIDGHEFGFLQALETAING